MTYSSGGLIQATDYNTRASNINDIWGVGSGSNGYGQSTTLSTVASAGTVTATQWATLVNRLESITQHQTGVTTGISAPTSGSTVTFLSTLDTKLAAIVTNKFSAATRGSLVGGSGSISSFAWTTSCTREYYWTFSDLNTVRYFFNAGGLLNMYMRVLSGTTTKSTDWDSFLTNQIGTISLGSNLCSRTGTGGDNLTQNTSTGYYNLTSTYQTLFNIGSTSATADYGNNYAVIEAKLGGALGGAGSNVVYMRFTLYDIAADIINDTVDGTTGSYNSYTPPETTYLTNTWGTPTVTAGTLSQS
jgi:hypothetical protein